MDSQRCSKGVGVYTPILVISVLLTCYVTMVTGRIKLVNNGYEGVVIAIDPDVPEDELILQRLEDIFTNASAMLFRATRYHLYFREFIVVLPEAWEQKSHYYNALDEQQEKVQIIVDRANSAYGNAPYVKQYAECGKSGLYIHITPDYVLDEKVYLRWGKPEKTMVHEWAHLRWGLFDEYPIDAEDKAYYLYNGEWLPTRCSNAVEGSLRTENGNKRCKFDRSTGTTEKNCRFYPDRMNKEVASLMFVQYLENVVDFCDDAKESAPHHRHNMWAPNRQNRLCNYRSAWEIMRKHDDFAKGTKELPTTTDTKPVFRYVQVKQRKRVLVLDTSGSMRGTSMDVMRQAASSYILSSIEDGSQLGIVHFNTKGVILSQLQEINSEADREKLVDSLPTKADGGTSIGSGLIKGVEVLTSNGKSSGGTIILITDGKETDKPYIADQQEILVKEGIVVHAMAYGQKAEENIASLAQDTGGYTFFYSGDPNSTAQIDGLSAIVQKESSMLPSENVLHSVHTGVGIVKSDAPFKDSFLIDSTIGRHTSLTFTHTEPIGVKIEGPDGVITALTHPDNFRYNSETNLLKVLIKPDPSPGRWTYIVHTNATKSYFTINIQSKARVKGQDIIKVSSWIWDDENILFDPKKTLAIYTEVLLGKAPMLGAEVFATIERPQAQPLELQLFDNGIGADIIKMDGVYSINILANDLKGDGRYNIKVKVAGTETKTKVIIGGLGGNSGALEAESVGFQSEKITKPAENFQRVTTAGEFRLKGYPANQNMGPPPDVMSPARISDFVLKSFDYKQSLAYVTWTSVGGDMERGTASQYIVYISEDFDQILRNTTSTKKFPSEHVLQGKLDAPMVSGEREEFILRMKTLHKNQTLYLSVLAVDDSGNAGDPSNVVSISPGLKLSVPRVYVNTSEEFPMFAVVIIIVILFLASVIILAACLVIRARRIKSKKIVQLSEKFNVEQSGISLDMAYMNYMLDGEYRKRKQEGPETWNLA